MKEENKKETKFKEEMTSYDSTNKEIKKKEDVKPKAVSIFDSINKKKDEDKKIEIQVPTVEEKPPSLFDKIKSESVGSSIKLN